MLTFFASDLLDIHLRMVAVELTIFGLDPSLHRSSISTDSESKRGSASRQ